MALTTYSGLVAAVPDWLTRSDATESLIQQWIALTEARIGRELRVSAMLQRDTATISDEFSSVPTDFLAPHAMRLTGSPYTLLTYRTPVQLAELRWSQPSGNLTDYARVGNEFWYSPAPSDGQQVELTYYAQIPALTSTNTTNWLLTSHPDAYLYGVGLEAGYYFEDQELIGRYGPRFTDAIEAIRSADRRDSLAANIAPALTRTNHV